MQVLLLSGSEGLRSLNNKLASGDQAYTPPPSAAQVAIQPFRAFVLSRFLQMHQEEEVFKLRSFVAFPISEAQLDTIV